MQPLRWPLVFFQPFEQSKFKVMYEFRMVMLDKIQDNGNVV